MALPDSGKGYLPALKYRWLTPLYDPVIRVAFRESTIKERLVEEAAIKGGQKVLDLGCGTGTLVLLLKRAQPDATVVGIDGDPEVLQIARRKAALSGLEIVLDRGMAYALPYPDESFDVVLTSLVLHHLTREDKARALREVSRVLRPGGSFHAADFGKPQNALMRSLAIVSELLEETKDGVEGRLPEMFRAAGLSGVEETAKFMTPLGTVSLYRARKLSNKKRMNDEPGGWRA